MKEKPSLGMYWASSCGGCEIALLNIGEKILEIEKKFDFLFCPCLLDTKKKDIEAVPNKSVSLTLFNGAIRTDENEEMALLLRKKSKIVIAFGSCAYEGCVPALSNLSTYDDHMRHIYLENPTTTNPKKIVPQKETEVNEGMLRLPGFHDSVKPLAHIVDVDYFVPGCPPETHQIWNVIQLFLREGQMPPKGSVIGANSSTVCDECEKKKQDKKIDRFYRIHEIIPDSEVCLLEQGIVCVGIATRAGCGALCPKVDMPCSGCYGPPEGVHDQGTKMIAALGSILNIGDSDKITENELKERIHTLLASVPDLAGAFYKYSLAGSILKQRIR